MKTGRPAHAARWLVLVTRQHRAVIRRGHEATHSNQPATLRVPTGDTAIVRPDHRDGLAQQRVQQLVTVGLRRHPPGWPQQNLAPLQRTDQLLVLLVKLA